jgi:hypothetical protein
LIVYPPVFFLVEYFVGHNCSPFVEWDRQLLSAECNVKPLVDCD